MIGGTALRMLSFVDFLEAVVAAWMAGASA
jgi:hypothetical protein